MYVCMYNVYDKDLYFDIAESTLQKIYFFAFKNIGQEDIIPFKRLLNLIASRILQKNIKYLFLNCIKIEVFTNVFKFFFKFSSCPLHYGIKWYRKYRSWNYGIDIQKTDVKMRNKIFLNRKNYLNLILS